MSHIISEAWILPIITRFFNEKKAFYEGHIFHGQITNIEYRQYVNIFRAKLNDRNSMVQCELSPSPLNRVPEMKLFAPFIIVKAFSVIVDVKAPNEEWMIYLSIKNYDVTHGYINPQLLASFTPIWKEKAIKNAVKAHANASQIPVDLTLERFLEAMESSTPASLSGESSSRSTSHISALTDDFLEELGISVTPKSRKQPDEPAEHTRADAEKLHAAKVAMNLPKTHSSLILRRLFGDRIKRLEEYLCEMVGPDVHLVIKEDNEEYISFLRNSYAFAYKMVEPASESVVEHFSLPNLVDKVVEDSIMVGETFLRNVLLNGYRQQRVGKEKITENFYPNSLVEYIKTSTSWQTLFRRIGAKFVECLLKNAAIFIGLDNGCFFQITGPPINHNLNTTVRTNPAFSKKRGSALEVAHIAGKNFTKKRRLHEPKQDLDPGVSQQESIDKNLPETSTIAESESADASIAADNVYEKPTRTYTNLTFSPSALFYARAKRTQKRIWIGLSFKHIFNRIVKMKKGGRKGYGAAHVMRYIFPKQFGMPNVFDTVHQKGMVVNALGNTFYREADIMIAGEKPVPKHLVHIGKDIEKIINSHKNCPYPAFYDQCCPKKVAAFVHRVIRRLVPDTFWGDVENRNSVFEKIYKFIRCGRNECTTLHEMLQGVKLKKCDWLVRAVQDQDAVAKSQKMRQLLGEFIWWLMESVVCCLLRTSFYITESASPKKRVLYFRHDVWEMITENKRMELMKSTYVEIPQDKLSEYEGKTLGYASLRLTPKVGGFRPITNLNMPVRRINGARSQIPSEKAPSPNNLLSDVFNILTLEKSRVLGDSYISGLGSACEHLKVFKKRLTDLVVSPLLYFAKVDIQACFDTINQNVLMDIVKDVVLKSECYRDANVSLVRSTSDSITKHQIRRSAYADNFTQFSNVAHGLAESRHNAIFVDECVYYKKSTDKLLDLLEEHIDDKYYRQHTGIPQGSIISTLLCSYFFNEMEQEKFPFVRDEDSLLLRYIDDFLFISLDKGKAEKFLSVMFEGHSHYGCLVNKAKSMTNFETEICGHKMGYGRAIEEPIDFPWCGVLINTKTLEVKCDYSRYVSMRILYVQEAKKNSTNSVSTELSCSYILCLADMKDTISVSIQSPIKTLKNKLIQMMHPGWQDIFVSLDLNTIQTVFLNLYQNYIVAAIKFRHYLQTLRQSGHHLDGEPVAEAIYCACEHPCVLKVPRNAVFVPPFRKRQLKWLGSHAFLRVFKMIKKQYPCLVKNLKIAKHQYCREDVEALCFASDINNSETLKTLLYGADIQI
ncbi:5243_t:CDS:10 [Paraglomus occultum]|uniref:Telomerase reverse transcriptase n=1 Tax=Paraglomus occultum TaxID=144539 RepID=A0A9N8YUP1_9GLOM|nr:5243_t:CDS:10 [Paraglomus occultum]